jgi:hypothetical protein
VEQLVAGKPDDTHPSAAQNGLQPVPADEYVSWPSTHPSRLPGTATS